MYSRTSPSKALGSPVVQRCTSSAVESIPPYPGLTQGRRRLTSSLRYVAEAAEASARSLGRRRAVAIRQICKVLCGPSGLYGARTMACKQRAGFPAFLSPMGIILAPVRRVAQYAGSTFVPAQRSGGAANSQFTPDSRLYSGTGWLQEC